MGAIHSSLLTLFSFDPEFVSAVDSRRLIAVSDFHPSTSEITSGFGFINSRSGLGGLWGFYSDPRRVGHRGKLLISILCAYLLY
jgi:hypothetical protein